MIVRVLVQSDDRENLVECKIPDWHLTEARSREDAMEILWHAFEMGRMRLEEMLAQRQEEIK